MTESIKKEYTDRRETLMTCTLNVQVLLSVYRRDISTGYSLGGLYYMDTSVYISNPTSKSFLACNPLYVRV